MLDSLLRKRTKKYIDVVGSFIGKTKINPNIFSSIVLIWTFFAFVFLIKELYSHALVFIIIASVWDAIDGSVARMQNKTSKWGNYFDAILDRSVEIIIYMGFALSGYAIEAFLIISGSLLISYAKARAALIVPINNNNWSALGDRADRLIILIIILILNIFSPTLTILNNTFSTLSLGFYTLIVIIFIGTIQRIIYAKKIIEKSSNK